MKQITIIIGFAFTTMLITLILLSLEGESFRESELNRAVAAATKQTVAASQIKGQKEITDNKEMVAHFIQILFLNLTSKSDYEIEIISVDYKNGLLDVIVTENFIYPNKKIGSINVRKTAVFE